MTKLRLPQMRCDTNCGKCCGPVPVTEREFAAVGRYIVQHGILPHRHTDPFTCPFYQRGTCAVYPVRPLICQVFGHSEKLTCAHGYNVNLPERDVRRAVKRNGEAKLRLHDFLRGGV